MYKFASSTQRHDFINEGAFELIYQGRYFSHKSTTVNELPFVKNAELCPL